MSTAKKIKPFVFFPPFTLIVLAVVFSLIDRQSFLSHVKSLQSIVVDYFGSLFCFVTLFCVFILVYVFFSPLAKVRIGGADAKPSLTRWRWFSITLCTTIAIGILFWAAAEPLYHLSSPPPFAAVDANSPGAARFALSTMFLHWTISPYALYTVPTLVFALSFYNMNNEFSLSAMLQPLFKARLSNISSNMIDATCLYSLVAGMAAALGAGILTMSAGVERYSTITAGPVLFAIIAFLIVAAFSISAVSGLARGIRLLSDWNTKVFMGFCLFVFLCGPMVFIVQNVGPSLTEYFQTFLTRNLGFGSGEDRIWLNQWTVFYWAVWMAWAPVTAVFLGRISYGYTVRECIVFNLILPASFSIVWMSVFSGSSLFYELQGLGFTEVLNREGAGHIMFEILAQLPYPEFTGILFLCVSFLSFVTAADSTTAAMGGLSTDGIRQDSQESPVAVKVLWGLLVGTVAWVMVSYAGIEGVKITSNLGGLPALFLMIPVSILLLMISLKPRSFLKK